MYRYLILIIAVAVAACTNDVELDSDTGERVIYGTPDEVVEWMDEILETYYLYNDEYNSMDLYMDYDYEEFLDYHLLNMKTNILDRKYDDYYGQDMIYSYIYREEASTTVSTSRSLNASEVGYGFVDLQPFYDSDYNFYFGVIGVYPGSPAEGFLQRGDMIAVVGNKMLSYSNYEECANSLIYPSSGDSVYIGFYRDGEPKTVRLLSATIEPNPVLHSEIIDGNIGYLVYSQFNSYFDTDLIDALKEMSSVEHFILDLRLNGGGYNSSAVKLGSAIRGNSSGASEVFAEYVYNSTISGKYTQYDYFTNNGGVLSLPNKRIYCLVSGYTASASELTINALRGVGYKVILIGDTTEGKNVGMFIQKKTVDGYKYEFAPITFLSKNAVGYYEYQDGMAPDCPIDEYDNFVDYGVGEPLLDAAIYHIENRTFPSTASVARNSESNDLKRVEIISRDRHRAMIMEPKEE